MPVCAFYLMIDLSECDTIFRKGRQGEGGTIEEEGKTTKKMNDDGNIKERE